MTNVDWTNPASITMFLIRIYIDEGRLSLHNRLDSMKIHQCIMVASYLKCGYSPQSIATTIINAADNYIDNTIQ